MTNQSSSSIANSAETSSGTADNLAAVSPAMSDAQKTHEHCRSHRHCGRSKLRKAIAAVFLVGVGVVGTLAVTGQSHAHFGSSWHGAMDQDKIQEIASWRMHWMLNRVDATSEQKQQVEAIVRKATMDLKPLREQGRELREQVTALLSAPTVDRQALEALRVDKLKTADQISQRITQAMADIAQVLTVEQRRQFAEMARKRWSERDARTSSGDNGTSLGRGDPPAS